MHNTKIRYLWYRIFYLFYNRMQDTFHKYYKSPVGFLKLQAGKNRLYSISFETSGGADSETQPEILIETCRQLDEYFEGKRKIFDLNLASEGTVFQEMVWKQVALIKFGETETYAGIARQVGTIKHTRAVGLANGNNPLPIVIPCHRVIGAKGKLTGYAGGIERKKWLLQHEINFSTPKDKLF